MSCYFLALIDVHDPDRYEQYLSGFDEVFARYGGEVLTVEDAPRMLEGEWPAGRTVLMRFPSEVELRRWYESTEYQDIARHRQEAAICRVAVLSGRD